MKRFSFRSQKPAKRQAALSVATAVAAMLAARYATAVTRIWDGGSVGGTDLGTAVNWSSDTLPDVAVGDTGSWDGSVAGPLALIYSNTAFAGVAGNPGMNFDVATTQTSSLNIDSGANTGSLRLNNITIAAGAGAFSLGDGAATFNLTLGGNPFESHTWTNNSANAAVINSDVVVGLGGAGLHTLNFAGSGNWTLNNVLGQGNGVLSVVKTGAGTLTLAGANTFTGGLRINGGTVVASNSALALGTGFAPVVVAAGANLNLATANLTYANNISGAGTINAGTLGTGSNTIGFTGSLSGFIGTLNIGPGGGRVRFQNASGNQISSLATINLLNGATLLADNQLAYGSKILLNGGTTGEGLGQLRIEAGANWTGNVVLNADSTIGGNTTPATISGVISGTGFGFTRVGSGTTILTNANTYTGATTIATGVLQLGNAGTTGSISITSPIVSNATFAVNRSNATAQGVDFGAISGTGGFEQRGSGTTKLTAANTYTGATTVSRGTLNLDFSTTGAPAANIVSSSSPLVLAEGTLSLTGKASTANSQQFAGLTINPGASSIVLAPNATANPLLLTLGGIVRNAGGTLNFTLPAGAQNGTNGITTTTLNTNGILGALTVGGNDWAANATNAAGGNIVPFSTVGSYTLSSVAASSAANYLNANLDVDASQTPDAAINPNTLRFSTAGAHTLTLTGTNVLTKGGILVNSTVGSTLSTITGGTLEGEASLGIAIYQNNTAGALAIGSIVADNGGATALTKSGAGVLTISGANTYTGNTFLNEGTLNVNNASALGATATGGLAISGGTLDNTSGATITTTAAKAVTVNGNFSFTGTSDLNFNLGTMTLGGPTGARTINVAGGTLSTGLWTGPVGYDLVKTGAGNLSMASTTNTSVINGMLDIEGGKIQTAGDLTVNGGLTGSGTIENGGAASKWFFVNNLTDTTFSGSIQDNPNNANARLGLVKLGAGTLNLTGANNVTGDRFSIENGTVRITGNYTAGFAAGDASRVALIGNAANVNGQLIVDGGNFTAARTASPSIHVGAVANARGFVKMNGGSITSPNEFWVGGSGDATTFGALTMSGGTINSGSYFVSGRNGTGVVNINGGTLNVSANNYENASFAGAYGVTNLSGTGTININSTGANGFYVGVVGPGLFNMTGGNLTVAPTATNGFSVAPGAGAGLATINGGTITTPVVRHGGAGLSILNLGGGTIKANAANANFMTGLSSVNLFAGGVTIDSNGFAITINQPLLAPTGNGVITIPVTNGGSGYIDTPAVSIGGGGGSGATAFANVVNGVVTSITVTSPGVGYTSAPMITLTGGGFSNPAAIGTVALAANTATGGFTKTGAGTLILASTGSTYGGPTTISGGTLSIPTIFNGGQPSATLGSSSSAASNLVFDGGALQYTGPSASTDRNFTINAGKTAIFDVPTAGATLTLTGGSAATNGALTKIGGGTLTLTGSNLHTGTTTVSSGLLDATGTFASPFVISGGRLNPGVLSIGALNVPALTLSSTGGIDFELAGPGSNDLITIGNVNGLTLGTATPLNLFDTNGAAFAANGTYTLFDYNTSFTGNLATAFTIANSQPGKFYSFAKDDASTSLRLTISDAAITQWNLDGGGLWTVPANWTAGIPNGVGAQATFGAIITAPATVTVNGLKTVGSITFDNFNSYTVAGSATDIITLNNGGGSGQIVALNGSHTISAPIALAAPANFAASIGNTLTLSGNITGGQNFTTTDAGTVVLTGSNALGGTATIGAGTLEIHGSAALAGATGIVERNGAIFRVGSAATVSIPQTLTFDLGTGTATGVSGQDSGTGNFTLDVSTGTAVTVSGLVSNPSGGSLVKTGEGAVTFTNSGANRFGNAGGLAFDIQNGSVTLNGGAAATYGVTGELVVGDGTPNLASFTLASGTLNVSTFTSVGRGNGTIGLASNLNITGGTLNTTNLFTGFDNGVGGYNASPTINISGTGVVNTTGTAVNQSVRFGESVGSLAMVNLSNSGTLTSNGDFQIGFGGKAVITVADSALINVPQLGLGYGNNVGGNSGTGVIRQSGGTVQQAGAFGGDWRIGGYNGNDTQAYGSYTISGGTMTNGGRNFQVGANGLGVLEIAGGTVTSGGFPSIGRFVAGVGLLNISSGSYTQSGTGNLLIIGEQGTGVVNVGGTGTLTALGGAGAVGEGGGTGAIRIGHTATGNGTLNLLGGTITTSGITESVAAATSYLYLNGGTLRASAANATFLQGLDNAVVGPNGVTIDTNGVNITVGQSLKALTGQGLLTIPIINGGSGYLGRPLVQISGGGGTGATAIANVDASGVVTGITITNPGIGYTSAPTVSLVGGGSSTPAFLDAATIGVNAASGGVGKVGAGTLTLTGTSSYTGATTVSAGTLAGTGSLAGAVVIQSGATLAPGNAGLGTLTVGGLTLNSGALLSYELDGVGDRVVVTGNSGLTINGGRFTLLNSTGGTVFGTNGVYSLIGYTGNIGGTGTSALTVDPASAIAGKNYLFGANGGSVTLTISNSGVTANFWNANADGLWTTGSNWTLNAAPNAPQAFANFGGGGTPITAPRTVTLNANQTVGSLAFNSAQSFTIAGSSTLTLDNGTDPASITVTGGGHTVAVPLNAVSSSVILSAFNAADALTISGALSGAASVTKNGPGTVTLSGANSYTGTTTLNDGTLVLSGAGTLGNTANPLAMAGGTLNLGGTSQTVGATTMAGGTIANGTLSPASITTSGTTDKLISANITGSGSVTKNGTGKLTLSGTNNYSGGTTINAGTLVITNNASLGDAASSQFTFNAGTTLQVDGTAATNLGTRALTRFPDVAVISDAAATFNIGQNVAAATAFVKRGLGTLTLSGTNTFPLALAVNAGSLEITGGTTTETNAANTPIQIANEANATAALTVSGTGTLNSNASEIYVGQGFANATGVLNLKDSGTINVGNWLAVGRGGATGTVNMSGGTLNKLSGNGNHVTIGSVGGTGTFNQSGGVINSADSEFFVGEVGTGTYNVSGTAQANLLLVRVAVQGNGTGTVNLNGGVINTGSVVKGAGNATFNFNGGTLRATAASADFVSSAITTNVGAGGAIIDSGGFDVTLGASLTRDPVLVDQDGGLTKRGNGTLTVSGFSSYTGPTVVETGTMAITGGIFGTTSYAVRSGATLDTTTIGGLFIGDGTRLTGSGTARGSVNVSSGGKLAPGDTAGTLTIVGDLNIADAVTPNASGALLFQLGSPADRVSLTSGTFSIGTGVLAFNDFTFTTGSGFAPGTYTLFDSTLAIGGTLSATGLSGQVGGFDATLSLADNNTDLVLTVVPEPGALGSLLVGMGLLGLVRRRRR